MHHRIGIKEIIKTSINCIIENIYIAFQISGITGICNSLKSERKDLLIKLIHVTSVGSLKGSKLKFVTVHLFSGSQCNSDSKKWYSQVFRKFSITLLNFTASQYWVQTIIPFTKVYFHLSYNSQSKDFY